MLIERTGRLLDLLQRAMISNDPGITIDTQGEMIRTFEDAIVIMIGV